MLPRRLFLWLVGLACGVALNTWAQNSPVPQGYTAVWIGNDATMAGLIGMAVRGPLENAFNQYNALISGQNGILQDLSDSLAGMTAAQVTQVNATYAVANSISGVGGLTQMTGQLIGRIQQLDGAISILNNSVANMQSTANSMNNAVVALNGAVSQGIAAGAAAGANAVNNGLGWRLDQISDILKTNSFASTNSVNITTTNGAVSLTNAVNVNVPAMVETERFATNANTRAAEADNRSWFQSPNTSFAGDNQPFNGYSQPNHSGVTVAGSFTPGFMTLTVPAPGGNHEIDMNPITHFGDSIAWFRSFCIWALTLGFLYKVVLAAEEYYRMTASAQQGQAPSLVILGNDLGKAAAPVYIGIICVAILALVAAMMTLLDNAANLTGQPGFLGALTFLGADPFSGLPADSVRMLDAFFPLNLIIAQAFFLLTMRPILMTAWWLYSMAVRVLMT